MTKIESEDSDPRRLWNSLKTVMGESENSTTASFSPKDFSDFFQEKIQNIRATTASAPPPNFTTYNGESLMKFKHTTLEEVTKIVSSSLNKQCALDPIPTWLLKKCLKHVGPFLVFLFNKTFDLGEVPQLLKKALVSPILKKPQLDSVDLSNYRPVSNLPLISKVLEKIVIRQITAHLAKNELLSKYQSAYRRYHSTETGLLRVLSDLMLANESGKLALLSLLDLSAAFDTIDHDFLIERLEKTFGLGGETIQWIKSYLCGRTQSVLAGGKNSPFVTLTSGVPQGSVLGPLLFILFINDVAKIIESFGLLSHCYADDQQIYFYCEPNDRDRLKDITAKCIAAITNWMSSNKLKLNPTKTEFLWTATKKRQSIIDKSPLITSGCNIIPKNGVKLLGVHLDQDLSLKSQINKTVSAGFFHLRQIKSIRRNIPTKATKMLVNSYVVSRLDYCNGIYANLPKIYTDRLQSVFNAAARLITGVSKYSHISQHLRNLHWLKCPERIQFKLCWMVFKATHDMAPPYLSELCIPNDVTTRQATLRSASSTAIGRLSVPMRNPNTNFGDRAFAVAGPTSWNKLPSHLREIDNASEFRAKLKTHLFKLSYPEK